MPIASVPSVPNKTVATGQSMLGFRVRGLGFRENAEYRMSNDERQINSPHSFIRQSVIRHSSFSYGPGAGGMTGAAVLVVPFVEFVVVPPPIVESVRVPE